MEFKDLGLSAKTLKAIESCGYTKPTEVQEKAVPKIIAGTNLVVRSQTGTGKTAAFGMGMVERIASGATSKALVLVPTRELATQVCTELQAIGGRHDLRACAVYGGQKIGLQIRDVGRKYDILVATPGRLQDLCQRGKVRLSSFNLVVLDEADHMLDIGFQKEVLDILSCLPSNRITLLFSATIDRRVKGIISRHMNEPEYIEVGEMKAVSTINEEKIELSHVDKVPELHRILDAHRGAKALVFLRTKRGVARLKEKLERRGFNVGMLQGDMEQSRRNRVISGFKEGSIQILIATNVAARGLHIQNVELIVNFDEAENKETHLHRIGRTARMGAEGKVINLISHDEPRKPARRHGGRPAVRGSPPARSRGSPSHSSRGTARSNAGRSRRRRR